MVEYENESDVRRFVWESTKLLNSYLKQHGLVIYSHKTTLRRNPVLFYGYNPGCDPDIDHPIRWKVDESLDYFKDGFEILQENRDSAGDSLDLLNDQCWPGGSFKKGGKKGFKPDYAKGCAPYQRRVRCLLKTIDHPDALVTNMFFLQTRDADHLRATLCEEFIKVCWEVHKLVFQTTAPRVIITFHAVVQEVFRNKFGLGSKPVDEIRAEHGEWKCRRWQGQWQGREICVVEIPHFSRYDITQPSRRKVLEWVKEIVRECANGWETNVFSLSRER